jgi:glycosyltransferase involved in cell wall biosynthesis/O-antigen/teichoic acid export membrane protein
MLKKMTKRFASAGFLISAIMAGNVLNFLFNAILGRELSLEQFSILTLVSSLWFIMSILLITITSTTNNRTAYLLTSRGPSSARGFREFMGRKVVLLASLLSLLWVMLIPTLSSLFHTDDYSLFIVMTPSIYLGMIAANNRGYFQGTLGFFKAGVILLTESISKLLFAMIFIRLGLAEHAYLAIPLSIAMSFIVSVVLIIKVKQAPSTVQSYSFPKQLMMATFLTTFSSVAFLTVDLLLTRHYLSSSESGIYALLSLVGKMIFFLGSLLNVLILTLASREAGLNKNTTLSFYSIILINIGLLFVSYLVLGVFGDTFIPMLFGDKSVGVLRFLPIYVAGISLFTIANSISTYHLAKQQFIFSFNSIIATICMSIGIVLWHGDLDQVVWVVAISSGLYLLLDIIFHILYRTVLEYRNNKHAQVTALTVKPHKKPFSVSICIPAYNEEHNINHILKQILNQKQVGFVIKQIIVASDGSTDNTVKIARKYASRGVRVIAGRANMGQTYRQNQLIAASTSDILVLLNADLLLRDDEVILRLIAPVMDGADLSAQWAKPVAPSTFVERVLRAGFVIKNYVYTHHRRGHNIYTCVGHMRALSRQFYTSVVFPTNSTGEDQYLYLACISGGYKYRYTHSHNAYFKLPDTLADYKKYAVRIFQTQQKYDKTFSQEIVRPQRVLPAQLQVRGCIYGFLKHPFHTIAYIILHILTQQWALRQPRLSSANFATSESTKKFALSRSSESWQ